MLPQATSLGSLEVLEVYEYYDGPRLLAARNAADQYFLCVWLGDDEAQEHWLYVAISERRLASVRTGRLQLREAFAHPEDHVALRVDISRADSSGNVTVVPEGGLIDADLPEAGLLLPDTSPDLPIDPRFRGRELLDLLLQFPTGRAAEAPLAVLGAVLRSVQEAVDAIGHALGETARGFGPIPASVVERTRLAVAETFSGSFGVRIASASPLELLDEPLVARAIAEMVHLVEVRADAENLRGVLHRLRGRTASRYRVLLTCLVNAGAAVELRWRSARGRGVRSAGLSNAEAAAALAVIREYETQEPLELVVTGVLLGLNVRTMRFEIQISEEQTYSGTIAEEAIPEVAHATMSETYEARIREITDVSPATGETKTTYELTSLRRVRG